ncbi:hypothetical protein KEM52_005686 [Ascosphaera acerosa]|nr:hypothetical protein KEM52_005686 [Ascosphaera acerosa]
MAGRSSESEPLLPQVEPSTSKGQGHGPGNAARAGNTTLSPSRGGEARSSPAQPFLKPFSRTQTAATTAAASDTVASNSTSTSNGTTGGVGPVFSRLRGRPGSSSRGAAGATGDAAPSPAGIATGAVAAAGGATKVGPQRTTKITQKLKLLPNPERDDSEDELEAIGGGLLEKEAVDGAEETPDRAGGRRGMPGIAGGLLPQDVDVYSQIRRIKEPTARRDAARLGKSDRERLPRVTAYCTASAYALEPLMRYLKGRASTRGTAPRLFDECVYSPYKYAYAGAKGGSRRSHQRQVSDIKGKGKAIANGDDGSHGASGSPSAAGQARRYSDSEIEVEENRKQHREDLIDLEDQQPDNPPVASNLLPHSSSNDPAAAATDSRRRPNATGDSIARLAPSGATTTDIAVAVEGELESATQHLQAPDGPVFDTTVHTPEVYIFNYGTVVIWGMTLAEETRFLAEIQRFADSVLSEDDMQIENFNYYYTRDYQARIYNDFISLRDPRNYMLKLAISHALAQSVKTSLFEDLVDDSIDETAPLPNQIAATGSVNLSRRQLNMQIGQLFILRINIHLQGSVLDAPELMWAEPHLDPVYQAVRSYLEMDQRVGLLTERLEVIADLLAVLKDQLTHRHDEYLEWIVIVLIAAEIVVAAINIVVDLYAAD